MNDTKPTTKTIKKARKIASPRLANAIEELVLATELTDKSTIEELLEALKTEYFLEARGL